jgi:heme/copper-type cytochrome/quinol oxidase subunit 4
MTAQNLNSVFTCFCTFIVFVQKYWIRNQGIVIPPEMT